MALSEGLSASVRVLGAAFVGWLVGSAIFKIQPSSPDAWLFWLVWSLLFLTAPATGLVMGLPRPSFGISWANGFVAFVALALTVGLAYIPTDQDEVGRNVAFLEAFLPTAILSFVGLLIGLAILALYYRFGEDR